MKWIGQHIWDYISRFRNDVYFENVENGATDTDKFLIIGASGKLKYRTGIEMASDIGAVTPNVYGSTIKLLPSDFVANIDGGNTKFGVGYVDTAGSAYGMKVGSADTELFAFVSIPEGMKATHVDVYDKDDLAIEVFEVQINTTTMTSKGTGNCNTTLNITDVNATTTNFLAIKVTTTVTTNKVFGGKVTIALQ